MYADVFENFTAVRLVGWDLVNLSAVLCHPWAVSASGWAFGPPVPRHQLVDAFLRPAIDEACQQVREVGLGIELACLDERRDAGPVFSAITTREETIFPASRCLEWVETTSRWQP